MKVKKAEKAINEAGYISELIGSIIRECPRRKAAGPDERRSQEMMRTELESLGLSTESRPFRFNDSLHANMALHFGTAVLGTAVSGVFPAAGFALHSLAAGSYWADATRRGYVLRRLLGFRDGINLIATAPAAGPARRRVVIVAHADAGFTGWTFNPKMVKLVGPGHAGPSFMRHPISLAVKATAALAVLDAVRMAVGPLALPLRPLEYALTVPALMAFLFNMQILVHDEVVPGANDNLGSVAALPVLARRLLAWKPSDVELVFVVSGMEEASLGGADALAHQMEPVWDKDATVVIAIDSIANGELNYVRSEGEVAFGEITPWLRDQLEAAARDLPGFGEIKGFEPPVGGTDAWPFMVRGWTAAGLVCVHPELGGPRHYHLPDDTLENLEMGSLIRSIDYLEALVKRLGKSAGD